MDDDARALHRREIQARRLLGYDETVLRGREEGEEGADVCDWKFGSHAAGKMDAGFRKRVTPDSDDIVIPLTQVDGSHEAAVSPTTVP